jgi:hypothetical protein
MTDRATLKAQLRTLSVETDAGFAATPEQNARITELAAALAAANPTPAPARADALIKGRWAMLYSSFGLNRQATLGRLTWNSFPKESAITVGNLYQEVDPATGNYDNLISFTDRDGRTGWNVVKGRYSPHDDERMDVVFFHTFIAPGAGVSEADFRDSLDLDAEMALSIPMNNDKVPPLHSSVTYLDEDFRLARGSYGNLYVLERAADWDGVWGRTWEPKG